MRDIYIVSALLVEVDEGGAGAFRRTAAFAEVSLTMVSESLNRVEAFLGCPLFEVDASGRRRAVLTPVGATFRIGASEVYSAWAKAVNDAWKVDEGS